MTGNWRDRAATVFDCQKQPAFGSRGMVVSNHPLASAAGAEMLLRQFFVHLSRSILDFEHAARALLDDGGVAIPVDPQLAPHVARAQGHARRGPRPADPEQHPGQGRGHRDGGQRGA